MRFHWLFSILCAGFAACGVAGQAGAQVLEIGSDGSVARYDGPVLTTSGSSEPIVIVGHPAATRGNPVQILGMRVAGLRPVTITHSRVVPTGSLGALFDQAARKTGVDSRLLHAVAWQETRFRHAEVSAKGAIGIMQLMPGTARGLGVDPRDLIQNVAGGARLLAHLLRQYRGNIELTLAAYNAGPDAVRRYGGVPPYAETREYVRRIKQFLSL